MATGISQLLVQHSIVLNHLTFLGSKENESKCSDNSCLCVGDCVGVGNHGNHWIDLAQICSMTKAQNWL